MVEKGWCMPCTLPVILARCTVFLRYKGLSRPKRNYRRPRLQVTLHMHARNVTKPWFLQMDVKYPQLSGLPHTCFEYAIMDIWSRYKEAVIVPCLDAEASVQYRSDSPGN